MSDSAAKEPPTKASLSLSPSSFPLTSLPDELAMSCLARVSRSDHSALSLVSKKYRSLVASPEFYKMRSQLGRTEERLYVCVSTHPNLAPTWLILRRQKPKTLETTVNLVMTPIPYFPFTPPFRSSVVVLDWGIYVIGGWKKPNKPTSKVLLLDCRTNTWRDVPSMGVARFCPGAGALDGKIYVFGGRPDDASTDWGEVFDPKTQTWDSLMPLPDRIEEDGLIRESLVFEEKVYGVHWSKGSVFYSPNEGKWGRTNKPDLLSNCVVENLLYGIDTSFGDVFWRESNELDWKKVKGLDALRMVFDGRLLWPSLRSKHISQVCNFGVNGIVLLWHEHNDVCFDIWCAEISFERDEEKSEVWGTVEWSEAVATLRRDPFGCDRVEILHSASVNV